VIRSTIESGKLTAVRTQSARSASRSAAKAAKLRRATFPLPGMLSQDMTVKGRTPRSRRRASASTTRPKLVRGAVRCWTSWTTSGASAMKSPVSGSTP
jgi:hypothetical protein